MRKYGLFLLIALSLARIGKAENIAPVSAPNRSELKQVLDRLQRHYRDTNSFSAKFNEEITTVGAPKRERTGVVSFRKPGRMRWEFAAPEVQTIVSDGEMLYSYDPDLNQVVETPLKQAIKSSSATSFLLGMGNINRDFKAAFPKSVSSDNLIHLMLNSKAGGYRIEIGLDPNDYNLVTLRLTDQLGDVTKVDFSDIQNNVAMPDSVFAFKAPAGADIVSAPATP